MAPPPLRLAEWKDGVVSNFSDDDLRAGLQRLSDDGRVLGDNDLLMALAERHLITYTINEWDGDEDPPASFRPTSATIDPAGYAFLAEG
jgi:hypothetical protein